MVVPAHPFNPGRLIHVTWIIKETLNLPKQIFPCAPIFKNANQNYWKNGEKEDIYHQIQAKSADDEICFCTMSPPYANGRIHLEQP